MDFSGWARPACVAQLGGVRPPQDPLASWFGRVRVALPGERWPATDGAPMLALARFNLRELPCRPPPALEDVALLTLFLGPWQLPVDEPNGVNWALRAYPSLSELVPLAEPTPARADDPKLRKGQDLTLRPFPIRWQQRLELPCREDIPWELLAAWDAWAGHRPTHERTFDGTKIGGWPYCIQSQVQWRTGGRLVEDGQYVLQLGSEHKAGLSWRYGAGLCRPAARPRRRRLAPHLAVAVVPHRRRRRQRPAAPRQRATVISSGLSHRT